MTAKTMRAIGIAVALAAGTAFGAMRPTPEYLKSAVVYQIVLRNFTRDGTFKAATEMLEHVRSAGIDVVYLTPFVEMDRDMDKSGWSKRQKASGFVTPKAVEFNADVKGRGSAILAERGELSADGMCRLGPYGFVVVDLQK